ncbi:MAG: Sec-independent protein translocase protein TatB [Candidatus Azotimanducaceae bacterium WSBS_2022_MAG_OTU7]
MFDIGFPELVVVSVVALLVIGPEKFPETIRTFSLWIGRIQRSFASIRREIESEIGADDIRQQLHNEGIMKELEETKNTLQQAGKDVRTTLNGAVDSVESSISDPTIKSPAIVEPAIVEPAIVEPAIVEPAIVEPTIVEPAIESPEIPPRTKDND